ncbi:MAG: hypothetical protein Q9195_003955 [Heterodermia aff. obscurata]
MSDPRKAKDGSEGSPEVVMEKPEMSTVSPIAPTEKQAKHWAKLYRTEISASTSSVFSTFIAPNTNTLPQLAKLQATTNLWWSSIDPAASQRYRLWHVSERQARPLED